MPKPILLTTDCGAEIDDQFALAHQALSPALDLRAIVTTHVGEHPTPGDSASEFTAACSREVLSNLSLPRQAPDVVAGSALPLEAAGQPRSGPGPERILVEAETFDANERLTVLAIGAVTDVASALLQDPSLAERVEVLAMGYNSWPKGGDPFNVRNDIPAWQALLDSGVPLTVGDSAVCKSHLVLTPEAAKARFTAGAGSYIEGIFTAWVEAHGKICKLVTGDERGWPIWDQVTTAHLLGMTEMVSHPRPALADDVSFVHDGAERPPVTWITRVDEDSLWLDLAELLAG